MKQFVLVLLAFFIIFPQLVLAQTPRNSAPTPTCVPVFGGGPTCVRDANIVVNKQIRDPRTGQYVDKLETAYAQNEEITFHIFVTNVTNNDLRQITIEDTFPPFLTFVKGDGSYSPTTRVFTASLPGLARGESKAFSVTVSVGPVDQIPNSPSPYCTSNIATVTQGGKTSSDTTPFCLTKAVSAPGVLGQQVQGSTRNTTPGTTTKGGLPIYSQSGSTRRTPATGPEDFLYLTLIVPALTGVFLRQKFTLSSR